MASEPWSEFLLCACVLRNVLLQLCFVICLVGLKGDTGVFLLYFSRYIFFFLSFSFILLPFPLYIHVLRHGFGLVPKR